MLVVISDLHLGDSTCAQSLPFEAFQFFRERLETQVRMACMRRDGQYRPVQQVDLLLLGDVLELLHSMRWFDESPVHHRQVRPWDDPTSPAFSDKLAEISTAILDENAESFALLRQMAQGRAISLPPADSHGRAALDTSERLPVQVRIYYMVGNHDWMYHLPGREMETIRQQIVQLLGLQNAPGPFPHELADAPDLEEICRSYRLFARHGDVFDSFNYDRNKGRNAATLGDALSIELFNRFPQQVELRLRGLFPPAFFRELDDIINVRPSIAVPLWISGKLQQSGGRPVHLRLVKEVWNEVVDEFLHLDFVRQQDIPGVPDVVDMLEAGLRLSRKISFNRIDQLVAWQQRRGWKEDISYEREALREQAFLDHQADYIVYGHSHHHEIVPLDAYRQDDQLASQWMINSGTWRLFYDLARRLPGSKTFMPYQITTFLCFYQGDERGGHKVEAWSGKLV
jgi:UDP-2,3-diacylglucosamine pyrophosphatase LpxH